MNRTVRNVLIGCGVVVLLGIVASLLVGHYVYSKKDEWVARANEIRAEGMEAGESISGSECLEGAMSRLRENPGRIGGIGTRVWLSGCLETARPPGEICEGVPVTDEIGASVAWRLRTCERFGFVGDSTCPSVLAEVQTYCGRR